MAPLEVFGPIDPRRAQASQAIQAIPVADSAWPIDPALLPT